MDGIWGEVFISDPSSEVLLIFEKILIFYSIIEKSGLIKPPAKPLGCIDIGALVYALC